MARVGRLEYYFEGASPAVIIYPENGRGDCWTLDFDDGDFVRDVDCYVRIRHSRNASYDELSRAEFIQEIEKIRGEIVVERNVPCEGPAVALYESIAAIEGRATAENRKLSADERALVRELRTRAHRLFEQQLIASGGYGTPNLDWTRQIPTPPKATAPPPAWQALPDATIADIARRLAGVGDLLDGGEPEAIAAALGWPIAESNDNLHRLDSRLPLPLTSPSATMHRDGTDLTIDVPLTDRGKGRDLRFAQFLDEHFDRARQICQSTLDRPPKGTGGKWPEILWETDHVGVFLRRGATGIALLALPVQQATARLRNVITDIEWDE